MRKDDSQAWEDLRTAIAQQGRQGLGSDPLWIADALLPAGGTAVALRERDATIAVGVVLETMENMYDSAEFVLLAVAKGLPGKDWLVAGDVLLWMISEAERIAKTGPRSLLEVALQPELAAAQEALVARGYHQAFSIHDMERQLHPAVVAGAGKDGLRPIRADDIPTYYALVRAAFNGVPGVSIPDAATFARAALAHDPPPLLLVEGGEAIGFVRLALGPGGVGRIELLGRDPSWRGRGLGPRLLESAVGRLADAGAREASLQVSSASERALEVYMAAGFRVERTTAVMLKALRPSGESGVVMIP